MKYLKIRQDFNGFLYPVFYTYWKFTLYSVRDSVQQVVLESIIVAFKTCCSNARPLISNSKLTREDFISAVYC